MRVLITTILALCVALNAGAQTAADSVKATIDGLFKAMLLSDSVALSRSFAPGALLQTVHKDQVNKTVVETIAVADFAVMVNKIPPNTAEERITYDVIRIDGDLAVVWTPYRFFYGGQLSHCGVNSIQLVKLADGWKIQYIIDTRRREGC